MLQLEDITSILLTALAAALAFGLAYLAGGAGLVWLVRVMGG